MPLDLSGLLKNLQTVFSDNKIDLRNFINIDNSKHIDNRKIELSVSVKDASKEELKQLENQAAPIIKQMMEKAGDFQLESHSSKEQMGLITGFSKKSRSDSVFGFVQENLPASDIAVWISALILRDESRANNWEEVRKLKKQIVSLAGKRGSNIANLCNEGYLETHIIPLHGYLVGESKNKKEFLDLYELIVTEHVFAVFAHQHVPKKDLVEEISDKIALVKQYGWDRVHIHAIGRDNVRLVKESIAEILDKCEGIKDTKETSGLNHIKVSLFV
ncbi:MAG: hypothetical protein ABFQ62_03660 [Patescibacteria group bacterium]